MRTILMLLAVSFTALARPALAIAQAEELPNVPVV
jgi:hypothetical protein